MRTRMHIPAGKFPVVVFLVYICLGPVKIAPAQAPGTGPPDSVFGDVSKAAKAEVSIVQDQQMDFGQLADHDGFVVLGLTDSIISDPNLIHYGGAPYSGVHTITGDPNTAVDISISSTPTSGLTLSDFSSSEGALPLADVLLDENGELILTIGATLTIDAATASIGSGQSIPYTITSIYN